MKRLRSCITMALACVCWFGCRAVADIPYEQGFEENTNGWTAYVSIERLPSGGGVLGLTSPYGNYHAEIQNLHDNYPYGVGLGSAGHTYFGGPVATYNGDFFQALTVYIDAANWAEGGGGFWLDETPRGTDNTNAWDDEMNFNFSVPTQGMVRVRIHGSTPLVTIKKSAWYTFVETFRRTGPSVEDKVQNDFLVYDPAGNQVASNTVTSALASPMLGGNGYLWITVWNNGFANDILAIDDTRTGFLPFVPVPMVGAAKKRTLLIIR